jgi:signal transduction histidine kinase/CheY-like chemotaxis protein
MTSLAGHNSDGVSVSEQSLAAQLALLPQALGVFAVCLPMFVWAGSFAQDSAWMSASFAIFALNWGVFYFAIQQLRGPRNFSVGARTRVHVLSGLLWSGAVWQISVFADRAGAARETLLMMDVGAALICVFFSTPSLVCLLIVGPAAMAGPLIALWAKPESSNLGQIAWGAFALGAMLSLILNQNLRRQFQLAAEREQLAHERSRSLNEAERLARSKSALLSTLSHEIRNGLTGVTHVLAAAAGQGGRAAPSREQLAAALGAAHDLIAVLNTTLDAESAELGRLVVDTAPFDPVPLLRELAAQARPLAFAKGLELQVYIQPELEGRTTGAAIGDPARVRQALWSLLDNAVKYTVRGRIEARVERRGEARLAIAIADTGPGLTEAELVDAFEPFQRVSRTAAGLPGAGLGLSLSDKLVKLMGAVLHVESAPGVGSCFTIDLSYDPAALIDLAPEAFEPGLIAHAPGAALKVLMAEEDGLTAALLRTILEQLGHQVVHAQNGRRALDLTRAMGFDLVVLDARMLQADGQAAAGIRQLPAPGGQVPIIAVIGGDAVEAGQCLNAGVDAVMRKPATVAGVARAIAEANANRKAAA